MTETIRLPETIEHVASTRCSPTRRTAHPLGRPGCRRRAGTALADPDARRHHHRRRRPRMAAQTDRLATVPRHRLDHLTEAEARAYVIADNRLAELAGWDGPSWPKNWQRCRRLILILISGFDIGFLDSISGRVNEIGMPALPTGESHSERCAGTRRGRRRRARAAMKIAARWAIHRSQGENGNGCAYLRKVYRESWRPLKIFAWRRSRQGWSTSFDANALAGKVVQNSATGTWACFDGTLRAPCN